MFYQMDQLRKEIQTGELTDTQIDGKWVAARPLPLYGIYGIYDRICGALLVLRGKADVLEWYKQ